MATAPLPYPRTRRPSPRWRSRSPSTSRSRSHPPESTPVALFGSVVGRFDRSWSRPRLVGVAVAVGLPIGVAAFAGGIVAAASLRFFLPFSALPVLVAGTILFTTVSLRMLLATTAEVVELTETDPDAARESVRALAGRDATDLSPADLRSAAVESAAENLADGFVAPLGGFALGATVGLAVGGSEVALPLAAGVAAAVWVKAVNTLDSMLGYRSKPVGWASARLDDAVMFLPARVTAGCLSVAAGSIEPSAGGRIVGREARIAELRVADDDRRAAALDVRLEKPVTTSSTRTRARPASSTRSGRYGSSAFPAGSRSLSRRDGYSRQDGSRLLRGDRMILTALRGRSASPESRSVRDEAGGRRSRGRRGRSRSSGTSSAGSLPSPCSCLRPPLRSRSRSSSPSTPSLGSVTSTAWPTSATPRPSTGTARSAGAC